MDLYFEMTIILITITIICVVVVYVSFVLAPPIAVYEHAVPVMKIVETFQEICPPSLFNQWYLLPIGIGSLRCWHRHFPMKILNQEVGVYGSSILISASSVFVISIIANLDNWSQWIPFRSKSLESKLMKVQRIKGDGFMHVVEIINEFNESDGFVFTHLSDDNLGWILFWNAKEVFMSFFLVQPVEENDGQCLLTCIFGCYLKSCNKTVAESLVFKLNSIKNATEISSTQVLPFYLNYHVKSKKKLTLNYMHKTLMDDLELLKQIKSECKYVTQGSTILLLLPYVQRSLVFIKSIKKFELTTTCEKDSHSLNNSQLKVQVKKNRCHTKSRSNLTTAVNSGSHTKRGVSEPVISSAAMNNLINKRPRHLLRRHIAHSRIKRDNVSPIAEETSTDSSNDEADLSDNFNVHDQECSAHNLEYEVILPERPISSQQMTDIKTRGNYSASVLQIEVLKAAAARFRRNIDDGPSACGNWSYFGTIKGIVIMSKSYFSGSLKIVSFICEAEILVKPEEVWNFIKNPFCRFVCDDSVKKLNILEEIAPDKKIVHVYHETGLIKKERVDFCFLQTERQEPSKSYLAFISAEFENCPLMESVTRGIMERKTCHAHSSWISLYLKYGFPYEPHIKLFPSGFVVETGPSGNESTVVKYLYQTVVNDPNSAFLNLLDQSLADFLHQLKVFVLSKPA